MHATPSSRSATRSRPPTWLLAGLAMAFLVPATSEAQVRLDTFEINPLFRLCPHHYRGDREFGGNGPRILASARLVPDDAATPRALDLVVTLDTIETRSDWTSARGNLPNVTTSAGGRTTVLTGVIHRSRVYTAPDGWRLTSWPNPSTVDAVDDNGHRANVFANIGFVRRYEIMGDTDGTDVGNCTADDVYLSAVFEPVQVRLAATTATADAVTLGPEVWTRLSYALSTLSVQLDNFSCTTAGDGSLVGCTRDANQRFFQSNASRVSLFGRTLSRFSIPEIGRTKPHWMYIENVNSSYVSVRPEGSLVRVTVGFEEDGFELTTRCIDNFVCGFAPDPGRGHLEGMRLDVFLRPTVGTRLDRTRGVTYGFDRARVKIDNFYMVRGMCNDNLFAGLCKDINDRQAGYLQLIESEATKTVSSQLDNPDMRGDLETLLAVEVCRLVTAAGRRCGDLRGLSVESGRLVAQFR